MSSLEDAKRLTRAQAQRMSVSVDENVAALVGKKELAKPQRSRRGALNNISNKQPINAPSDGQKSNIPQPLKKPSKPSETIRAEPPVTRRKSRELEQHDDFEPANENDSAQGRQASVVALTNSKVKTAERKARTGLTRNLIATSERAASVNQNLAQRMNQVVQLDHEDSVEEMDVPRSPLPNIDKGDMDDCALCAEYALDIFEFFRRVEPSNRVQPDYMSQQRFITRHMRAVLADWLVDVHTKFKMIPETLFLAVWIIDKFLGRQEVDRRNLQLVGITALMIASKYEEVYGPVMKDFEHICDGAYTRSEILSMERVILKTLGFHFTVPTAFTFLSRYVKASGYGQYAQVLHLAQYLCEWSLLSYTCLRFPYSMIAAAAVHAAMKTFGIKEDDGYPRALRKHSGYELHEIKACAAYLVNLQSKAQDTQFKALYTKFKRASYSQVARYPAPLQHFKDVPMQLPPLNNNQQQ